jgi:hypothetical protein
MDAAPILTRIAELLNRHKLEAIMVGNAMATMHVRFFFRKTPANIGKLKAISRDMQAVILRPFHPAGDLFRVMCDGDLVRIDFIPTAGAASFEAMRKRASRVDFGGNALYVAATAGADRARIRRWQALPPEKRTNFLRARPVLRIPVPGATLES